MRVETLLTRYIPFYNSKSIVTLNSRLIPPLPNMVTLPILIPSSVFLPESSTRSSSVTDSDSQISDDLFHQDPEIIHTSNISVRDPVTLNLVYVPDPTRYSTKSEAENDISWLKVVLNEEEIAQMEALSSDAFHVTSRSRKSKDLTRFNVIIQEWVSEPDILMAINLSPTKALCGGVHVSHDTSELQTIIQNQVSEMETANG